MKKRYLDVTNTNDCVSIYIKDTEIIPSGTIIYSMPVKHKNAEYQKFAEEYDIHFIFDDEPLQIDFYTVPQVDVFARDSQGGYFGTIGQMTDLEANAPICYIDKSKQCFLVSENGIAFLENAQSWRMYLQECDEVKIYDSKEDAMKELDFLNLDEFL